MWSFRFLKCTVTMVTMVTIFWPKSWFFSLYFKFLVSIVTMLSANHPPCWILFTIRYITKNHNLVGWSHDLVTMAGNMYPPSAIFQYGPNGPNLGGCVRR